MDTWHTCENHSLPRRVGSNASGRRGVRRLEKFFDPLLAAMKIYDASCSGFQINPCRFFDSDEDALADAMKRL